MSLILDLDDKVTGYITTFEDKTHHLAALGKRDRLLSKATEGLRGSVANLRAAAETLNTHRGMTVVERAAFDKVIFDESNVLSGMLENLTSEYRDVMAAHWPMTDIYSANLLNGVVRRMARKKGFDVVMTGLPQRLHGDSHTLVELLEHVLDKVREHTGIASIDLEASPGERRVYLDLIWKGSPVPAAVLDRWMDVQLKDALGGLTARDILELHKTELWSQSLRAEFACVRLPLSPAAGETPGKEVRSLPARPEFYDFDISSLPADLEQNGERYLRSLTFVVFDTETTGLKPSEGDEIISIAGVRIVNGRILTGESFSEIVHPGRPIPPDSIFFHGITDEMVAGKPPIEAALPRFKEFVADSVLVAHNAAFDMKFLKLKEESLDMVFDNAVLDTLLLSAVLHDETTDHSLDAIAERFGIEIEGRHTALGDSLVTAGIFLRMIDMLEAIGIRTLDQAVEASDKMVKIRALQARF